MRKGDYLEIEKFLLVCQENAIRSDILIDAAGLTDTRTLRKKIAERRKDGIIICSCNEGYFMPRNTQEIVDFYRVSRRKAISLLSVLASCRKRLEQIDGQLVLEDCEEDYD